MTLVAFVVKNIANLIVVKRQWNTGVEPNGSDCAKFLLF